MMTLDQTRRLRLTSDDVGIAWFNPLMDDVQTGLDTLSIQLGEGSSDWTDNTESSMNDTRDHLKQMTLTNK